MTKEVLSNDDLIKAITLYLRHELMEAPPIGARLKFAYVEGGSVLIDGSQTPSEVTAEDGQADCVVTLSLATHIAMLRFQLDQGEAFRRGELTISGDISVALRLAPRVSTRFRLPDEAV
jgi:putative sterol carrier protein